MFSFAFGRLASMVALALCLAGQAGGQPSAGAARALHPGIGVPGSPAARVQVAGTFSIPGSPYATIAAAIAALNAGGVGSGGATFNVAAGHTETFGSATAGLLTATGTAANPIVFQKAGTGANPLVTAGVGTLVASASGAADAILTLEGADYVTFDGIDLRDPSTNNSAAKAMEFGVLLARKGSGATLNGCTGNTIKNATITLQRAYASVATGTPMGIVSTAGTLATPLVAASATGVTAASRSSSNRFVLNTIQNVNTGIWLQGLADVSPYANYDQSNTVGGVGAGNTIRNFGGAAVLAAGVRVQNQNVLTVSNNIIDNAAGGGVVSTNALYGVLADVGSSGSQTISTNTITLSHGPSGFTAAGVWIGVVGAGTSTLTNNTIAISTTNATTTAATGSRWGVINMGARTSLTMTGNQVALSLTVAGTGGFNTGNNAGVRNDGAVGSSLTVTGNTLTASVTSAVAATCGQSIHGVLSVGTVGGNCSISSNTGTFTTNVSAGTMAGQLVGVNLQSTATVGGTLACNSNTYTFNVSNAGTCATTGNMFGVVSAGAIRGAATFNFNRVTFAATNASSTTLSGAMVGVQNTGALAATGTFSSNTIGFSQTNTGTGSSSGSLMGVVHAMGVITGAATMSSNTVSLAVTKTAGITSSAFTGVANTTANASTLTLNSNILQNAGSTATGTFSFLSVTGTNAGLVTVTNNQCKNSTVGTTGNVRPYNVSSSSPNVLFQGNVLSGMTFTGVGATVQGFYNFGSPMSGTETITGNTFSGLTLAAGTGKFYGIYANTASGQVQIITNNTVSTVSGAATGTHCGIYAPLGAAGTQLSGNAVQGIDLPGSTLGGIFFAGTAANLFNNRVGDLASGAPTGVVTGIQIDGGNPVNVYNNRVGDLRAPAAAGPNQVVGLNVSRGTAVNAYFNSIYLNAASTGADFGTSGIWAATTPTVDLRDNVVVNTSAPAGTGLTVAYRRTTTTATTYAATSDYNLWYAGTPGASRLLYADGTTTYPTLAAWQAGAGISPREAHSQTEAVPFVSTSGTNANFLRISPTVPTRVESGGSPVTSPVAISTDFEGEARHATTPDIGADEGSFLNINTPTISSFTPTSGHAGTVVTINGTNFPSTTSVTFGGVAAAGFAVVSATRITATVPVGAVTGNVQVTTAYGTATRGTFTYTGPRPLQRGAIAAVPTPALWPNPARATVQISGVTGAVVTLADALGRPVLTAAVTDGAATLDVRGLPEGVYTVRASNVTRRLVVTKD